MKAKIKGLGVQLMYPLGNPGPYMLLRRYTIEAEDGRIDHYEEVDEPQIPDGEYDFEDEVLDSIFNKEVEVQEEW